MKDYKAIYEEWLSNPYFDQETKEELRAIRADEKEIKERFYMDLEFGTAGLRGVIGAGINRMNIYTVRRATQGLADYILEQGGAERGVAIADLLIESYGLEEYSNRELERAEEIFEKGYNKIGRASCRERV